MPALNGSTQLPFSRFEGLCLDVDPAELPPSLASACANVDTYGATLRLRRGRAPYNATAPAAQKVLGLHDYYPAGAAMIPLMALKDGKVYIDLNSDGDFADANETNLTGLSTSATFFDFVPWKDRYVYFSNGINAVYKWDGNAPTAAAALVAVMTAPAAAALLQPVTYEIDNCEGAWTGGTSTTNLTAAEDHTVQEPYRGTGSARFLAAAAPVTGSNYKKAFSAGTQDLSGFRWVRLAVSSGYPGAVGQVVIEDNNGSLNPALFPNLDPVAKRELWQEFYLPLDGLAPADRTASPGFAFYWVHRSTVAAGGGYPQSIWIDNLVPIADLVADEYAYSATFYNPTTKTESGPGASAKVAISKPLSGIAVAAPRTGADSGVTKVFLYRIRKTGFWRFPRKVGEVAYLNGVTASAIASTGATSITVSAGTNIATGDLLRIDSELLKVTAGGGTTTLTVVRGWGGSIAATHANGALVYLTLFDTRSDGDIDLAAAARTGGTDGTDGQELRVSIAAPPICQTLAAVNSRLFAGNVTLSGTSYPYRVYVSRQGFPEEFADVQEPADPGIAGWFDLKSHDPILRIIEFDGAAVIFTSRAIYTCEGSGFDDYVVAKRADVGLVAREAVAVGGRLIYFLAPDGLRVLAANRGTDQPFETWVLSEPVRSLLQALPYNLRGTCALGVDDLGRLNLSLVRTGQSAADAALVFDPRIAGALAPGPNPMRPGWTYYLNWGFACARTLRNGSGGESGGLVVGDVATGKLHRLGIDQFGRDLALESGGAAWYWQSNAGDAGEGQQVNVENASWDPDVTNSQKVRLSTVLDGVTGDGYVVSTAAPRAEFAASQRGRRVQVRLDSASGTDGTAGTLGNHTLPIAVRAVGLGVLAPLPRG